MVEIPQPEVTDLLAELTQWHALKAQVATLQGQERLLRQRLFRHCFPNPQEGTNTYGTPLPNGYVLKGKYALDRKVDPGALAALKGATVGQWRDTLRAAGCEASQPDDMPVVQALRLPLDTLLKYEPELVTRTYRTLTEDQRAIFDACLTVKPGSPALEIVKPKGGSNADQGPN